MSRPLTKLAHQVARRIRLERLPFIETSRGRCEICGDDGLTNRKDGLASGHRRQGPRRFCRIWFEPLSLRAPHLGSIKEGKRRCAHCVATGRVK